MAAAGAGGATLVASCGVLGLQEPVATPTVSTRSRERRRGPRALLDQVTARSPRNRSWRRSFAGRPRSARRFLAHERRHAAALERAIRALGGAPAPPRPRSEYTDGFPRLQGARDALSFALDVETTAVAAYSDALGKIATDGVRFTAATIFVTEAEHSSVILGELGRPQMPDPFVTGPPPESP